MTVLYHTKDYDAALKKLGIQDLRAWQKEVLKAVIAGKDTIYIAPTGGGKSLIYQMPAVMETKRNYLTIVISPMLALQEDQVRKLTDRGVKAVALNSRLSDSSRRKVLYALREQTLLFLAPEQLGNADLKEALKRCDVSRVVVDEAHLIPEQQGNFRPAFSKIGDFIESLPYSPQILACTATATEKDCLVIKKALQMSDPLIYHSPIYRDNLDLTVKRVQGNSARRNLLLHELKQWNRKGLALVFAPTVKEVKRDVKYLCSNGIDALGYYSDMPEKEKKENVKVFASGKCKIMVATTAFGLGVDIPNIRLVIHAGLPLGLTEYVQQIGRGGRNGKKTRCLLIYADGDIKLNRTILWCKDKKEREERFENLDALQKAIQNDRCLWKSLAKYYGQEQKSCGHCNQCRRKHLE